MEFIHCAVTAPGQTKYATPVDPEEDWCSMLAEFEVVSKSNRQGKEFECVEFLCRKCLGRFITYGGTIQAAIRIESETNDEVQEQGRKDVRGKG